MFQLRKRWSYEGRVPQTHNLSVLQETIQPRTSTLSEDNEESEVAQLSVEIIDVQTVVLKNARNTA